MDGLSIRDVHKSYASKPALAAVSFDVHPEEIIALLGPSGCGKSTLLDIIAGLEHADQGDIFWNGADLSSIPVHERGFGLMFQDFALFPHKNVFENIAFGLQMAKLPPPEVAHRVGEVLELVGLPGFEQRSVNDLSGGEAQRVALARSIAPAPDLLMLDEPLGSLDRNLRERLVADLREILRSCRQTAIYVTHDQEEAFALADRVVLMNAGRVEQIDTPLAMYREPGSEFAARFMGLANLIRGEIVQDGQELIVKTGIGVFPFDQLMLIQEGDQRVPAVNSIPPQGRRVVVLLRPDMVNLDGQGLYQLKGEIIETSFRGSTCQASIQVNQEKLLFYFPPTTQLPETGETVRLGFDPLQAVQVFIE